MKSLSFALVLLVQTTLAIAQTNPSALKPEIKKGSKLGYEVYPPGNVMQLSVNFIAVADSVVMRYDLQGMAAGQWVNTKESLANANRLNWDQPVPDEVRVMAPDESICMFSRNFLQQLKQQKKATYDGVEWTVKEVPKGQEVTIGDKNLDIVHITNSDGSIRYWILNNDKYPLMVKAEGNPQGVDLLLKSID